jgi:hypothetical protein
VPGLAPDTVTQQGKTVTQGGTVPPLGQRSGTVAVPSNQVGVKSIQGRWVAKWPRAKNGPDRLGALGGGQRSGP